MMYILILVLGLLLIISVAYLIKLKRENNKFKRKHEFELKTKLLLEDAANNLKSDIAKAIRLLRETEYTQRHLYVPQRFYDITARREHVDNTDILIVIRLHEMYPHHIVEKLSWHEIELEFPKCSFQWKMNC